MHPTLICISNHASTKCNHRRNATNNHPINIRTPTPLLFHTIDPKVRERMAIWKVTRVGSGKIKLLHMEDHG